MKFQWTFFKSLVGVIIFLNISAALSKAQNGHLLTLDRIYSSGEFVPERFGPAKWLESSFGYTTLEKAKEETGGFDIIRYNPKQKEKVIVLRASQLIPEGETSPLLIEDYFWSSDGTKVLIFTNSKRVWRKNTRGDYWVMDLHAGRLWQVGKFAKPSTLMFAKFSPDGEKVAYVYENNLYVEDLQGGKVVQLTQDGSTTIINGTFDWAYEEEFGCRDGFRWSPNGESIAFWQLDASGVRNFNLINYTDSLYSQVLPIQYPKVGEKLSACKVAVVPADGGTITWMQVEGDPRNNYIPRMEWAGNSNEILFQQLNRPQNRLHIMVGNATTGRAETIYTEEDEAWIDVNDNITWLEGGEEFTWLSEKNGWRHLYRVSKDGKKVRSITKGDFDVISVLNIDEKGGYAYFIASPYNATQRYLYRTKLKGSSVADRLTPFLLPGINSYQLSPDAKWAIHTFTNSQNPPVIDVVTLPEHATVETLIGNKSLKSKLGRLDVKPVEFFRVDIGDEVILDGWMIKPMGFDPTKKYPVLFHIYGEPAGQTVLDRQPNLWHLLMSQKGYLVISLDNRGTPAPKGREWRKSIYKKIGVVSSEEQAKAANIIGDWQFVDKERIAIWGWSGGGSGTLNAIFRYPEIYHTGMSVAPVPDQTLYDAIYQERYMGLLDENIEAYKQGSPITFAKNLKGNLLIVHGTGDDNVHYQGTERLINELVKYNKHFTMMAYPNRSHSIYEGPGTTRHLYGLLTRYLLENMPPGAK